MASSPLLSFSLLCFSPQLELRTTTAAAAGSCSLLSFSSSLHLRFHERPRTCSFVLRIVAISPASGLSSVASLALSACSIATGGNGRPLSDELDERLQALASSSSPLQFSVQEASCSSHLYAAAALRARTFYNYPQERSLESRESHQKYMTAVEWRMLQSKVAGKEMGFGRITCLVAVCSIKDVPKSSRGSLEGVTVSGEQSFVIGTLDLNQGRTLPGEIQGSRPHVGYEEYLIWETMPIIVEVIYPTSVWLKKPGERV